MTASLRHRLVAATAAVLLCVAGLAVVGPADPAAASPAAPLADEWDFFRLHNGERTSRNLGALDMQTQLMEEARRHAQDMANRGYIYHRSDLTRGAPSCWTRIGENVGVGGSPGSLNNAFMNSPGHRANILGDFTHMGIGVVWQDGRLWVAVIFMKAYCGVSEERAPSLMAPFGKTNLDGTSVASGSMWSGADRIFGAGNGQRPEVRVFDSSGNLKANFLAYNKDYRGGIYVAAGDVDGDGTDEIITAPRAGGPHVKMFERDGTKVNGGFFAYSSRFTGGVNIGAADINGDGKDEVLTGPGQGHAPLIRAFNKNGARLRERMAYTSAFKGGVYVDGGRLDDRGRDLVVTGVGVGGGPHVKVLDLWTGARAERNFFPYDHRFRGGVTIGVGTLDGNGYERIITGVGPGGGPHLKVWPLSGRAVRSVMAFEPTFGGGIDIDGGPSGIVVTTFNRNSRSKKL